jgi:hypothetical protein
MSVNLRWEQCCTSEGCKKPARHGSLCASCFLAATPARRSAELLGTQRAPDATAPDDLVSDDGALWLQELWAA